MLSIEPMNLSDTHGDTELFSPKMEKYQNTIQIESLPYLNFLPNAFFFQ